MRSKITGGETTKIFTCQVLGKYSVDYFRCDETGFIQTQEPYWLEESYSDAISELDIGLVQRNLSTREITVAVIDGWFNRKASYVDYGGGYGLFVRLMRDQGYDFYRVDPYCVNLFAKSFDWNPESAARVELLTAWEVFEHLSEPMAELQAMLAYSRSLLFSTELVPDKEIRSPSDWWYFIPETGQHVSLHTRKSLEYLAAKNNLQFYSNGCNLHLMTERKIGNPFQGKLRWFLRRNLWKLRKYCTIPFLAASEGLAQRDFREVSSRISDKVSKSSDVTN